MSTWDYIIIGAGSAGCVLADRLTVNPNNKVLLLEAGPKDRNSFIHMPKGAGKLITDPKHVWFFKTEAHDDVPAEVWIRGKVLGGSSSVNGMMYFRGQPEDYDGWEEMGAKGWGWSDIGRAFRAIENHQLGDDGERGGAGPLNISVDDSHTSLTEAFIKAGEQMGLARVEDLNRPAQGGVGYTTRTIHRGQRISAAKAFLKPAMARPNLQVVTDATVSHIIFNGRRAIGVAANVGGQTKEYLSDGEVLVSTGALTSPALLQRSGIGPASHLQSVGIKVVADSPGVGAHMLEHRLLMMQYRLTKPVSVNSQFRGLRLLRNVAQYYLSRTGPMASGSYDVGAFVRTLNGAAIDNGRPDAEILMAPYAFFLNSKGAIETDQAHSMHLFGYPLRSRSEGWIKVNSPDPAVPATIHAGYLSDPYDREVTVAMFRYIRRWLQQPAIASMIAEEVAPGPDLQSDEDIIAAFRSQGQAGYHACGTCRMGAFEDAVLDERLRVKGVDGLRVVDGSIMPAMVSANTNGPIMAASWRAAELILEGKNI